jgi:DNA (cytosine-5)-methyltransferase 1
MAFAGECWTLKTSESHSEEEECSLSQVVETTGDLSKYYLSPTAAAGILRRAGKRGKELPLKLKEALTKIAMNQEMQ